MTILFLTTADTEVLAARRAAEKLPPGFPPVHALNPTTNDVNLDGVQVVLVRLLGGRRAWAGFDAVRGRCLAEGVPLLAFSGEATPDAELTALSTAPAGVVAEAFAYLVQGGVGNTANLFRFVADTLLRCGFGFDPPVALPEEGVWGSPTVDPSRPTVGVVFYRTHWMSGNTGFVAVLCEAIEAAGANALPVFCYSLRPRGVRAAAELSPEGGDPVGAVPALQLLHCADAVVLTVLAMGGSTAADADGWSVPALEALGVPVIQSLCATSSRAAWDQSSTGLSPLDVAMQVALPEFDGRIVTVPFSFKEVGNDGTATYVADPERAARVAGIATRLARLRHTPNDQKRVAVMLSNYPTKHSRVGNAVGLDTPASAVRLLDALTQAGYDTGDWADRGWDGDQLVHALIAAGGHDAEFLTESHLKTNPLRVRATRYAQWFARLPDDLRAKIEAKWGTPPGELYRDRDDLVVAGLELGNVLLGIQPPRGFGENPVAIYHDPDLPPTHHYLAVYRWLVEEWGADAVVHLGKHGTLEWLPGKGLGLSASCAPDAVLGDLPLLYPFVVNDPGEGTQAKRRAHAVIVDHLVPPMTRAETYDDLARLEQLLDEYYQVSTLDPTKLPAIRGQIWQLLRAAELHRDLGVEEPPSDFDEFLIHVDGYLCEIKDAQIRGGLHVLGQAPAGEERIGLVLAILRLPQAGLPGLREALGLDEETASRATVDQVEARARALVEAMDAKGWDPSVADAMAEGQVADVLRFAATEVVPRLVATDREIARLLDGLDGRYVPAGPSGSPTRGRVDVLPTGKNFYSVDPKGLPSELSWAVGQRLADDLCARYRRETGEWPTSIGIVVWGTSAMRTHGDDIAEVLALLGVRPRWHPETRRVTGLELVSLDELGRPRVDVTVRISGFFRDAFPHLVQLMDDAVAMVASVAETAEQNPVAAHVRADLAAGVDRRRATARVFGSKPGAYGAGLLPLIDARNWQTDADLAEVYAVWGGYAYGRDLDGVEARDEMARTFSRIRVAVKNTDTHEHDLLDSDDYFQYHGGMVAAVRALTGSQPRAYIGDSADPARVRTRDLREETARVFRCRVANPKWIDAMRRHGYKGAFELSATVDYLFGYDATAGVVEDWMYEQLSQRYVFDPEVRAFMERSNPWALRAVAERLLEAADRRLWADPDPDTLDRLRAVYLELEGDLEDRDLD
ncbi:MAG: cobaltochelatase subunit CobN [Egibacteraceae bacterium]